MRGLSAAVIGTRFVIPRACDTPETAHRAIQQLGQG
jgi:hypothetical protein